MAAGFLPCAIVILVYHLLVYGTLATTFNDVSDSAIPSVLILAGILFLAILWRSRG
jgi:hypothetical protein